MYPSRPPSNPDGPANMYIPQVTTRASSRMKYTGPDKNIFGVDARSVLGRAFFHVDNRHILKAELYSQAVLQLKHKISREDIAYPTDTFIYEKTNEWYPVYAPMVHRLDATSIPQQVRELNRAIIAQMLPNYLSNIRANQYYLKSLQVTPARTELPAFIESASQKELTNRSNQMTNGVATKAEAGKTIARDQMPNIIYALPHNPWLASRMPDIYGSSTTL